MDSLQDNHLPYIEEGHNESNSKVENNDLSSAGAGAGSTKRKELHGTIALRALSGSWMDNPLGATFHACKISFTCNSDNDLYSEFVLLTESKLDNDVAKAKVDLYLLDKMVYSSIMPYGEVQLSLDQIRRAMRFHELLFNGLFGKLFKGSKASGTPREFLLQREKDSNAQWNPSYMYLILPLESQNSKDNPWSVSWKEIDSCVSVIEFMKTNSWLSAELSERKILSSAGDLPSVDGNSNSIDDIYMANSLLPVGELKDTVVMAIHTGRIYYVVDMLVNTSAESPFDENAKGKPVKYSSFSDYFNKKYEIVLHYPGQPLFLLKQTHNPFNLLIDSESGAYHRKIFSNCNEIATEKPPQSHVRMPPELLVRIDVPLSVLRALYLLPSLMQRLESLMLACQLREDIGFNLSDLNMSSSLILEALTTLRCCEYFSSERLELLGDSVLKYAVSCHLFLKCPKQNEGKLSGQRQRAVCNATLHELGINRRLQEYIRDSAFEPRRWVAPGQLSVHPVPCSHGIDASEVPVDSRFQTIDENIILGKNCDNGHRWMVSKGIADFVEALIGAYYVGSGLVGALHMMKWLGIEAELELSYVDKAIKLASDRSYSEKNNEIVSLESKLGYNFSTKGLLLEAITFAAEREVGLGYSYERLEFLGDAVLDFLITGYLYENHSDIDPGELTDLRSASVNNENFAQITVRRNLYPHLQNCSTISNQITEYVQLVMDAEDVKTLIGRQFPKALGDLFESIAGAILIDTKLNVKEVWRIFEPLLSPIVTPDNLELAPFRELNQLCACLGYFFKECCVNDGSLVLSELRLQLKDILLIGEGIGKTVKGAKGQAALHLLKDLESRGLTYVRYVSKGRKQDPHDVSISTDAYCSSIFDKDSIECVPRKKQKTCLLLPGDAGDSGAGTPVIAAVGTQKGGPRTSLYELCKRLQWPMPSFETTEHKSRSPIEFGEGSNRRQAFNSYASKISLHIPDFGVVEASGEQRAEKKTSLDSATLCLLYKLEQLGKLVIGCS